MGENIRHATRSLGLLQFPNTMINAVLVFNNNGQPRLTKFYSQLDTATQQSLLSQIFTLVSARPASACNFLPLPPLLAPSSGTTSPDAPTQIIYRVSSCPPRFHPGLRRSPRQTVRKCVRAGSDI